MFLPSVVGGNLHRTWIRSDHLMHCDSAQLCVIYIPLICIRGLIARVWSLILKLIMLVAGKLKSYTPGYGPAAVRSIYIYP